MGLTREPPWRSLRKPMLNVYHVVSGRCMLNKAWERIICPKHSSPAQKQPLLTDWPLLWAADIVCKPAAGSSGTFSSLFCCPSCQVCAIQIKKHTLWTNPTLLGHLHPHAICSGFLHLAEHNTLHTCGRPTEASPGFPPSLWIPRPRSRSRAAATALQGWGRSLHYCLSNRFEQLWGPT